MAAAAKKKKAKTSTAKKKKTTTAGAARKTTAKKVPARKAAAKKVTKKKATKSSLPHREAGTPGFGISPTYLAALPEYEKGMALLQKRAFDKAEVQFERMIRNYPGVKDLVDRARTYIALCQKQRQEAPPLSGFEDFYYRGVYLGNRGDYDDALSHLDRALALEPDDHKAHYAIASVLCLKGERDRALESLQRAVKLEPSNRIHAKSDPDFQGLHGDPEFDQLVGGAAVANETIG